MLQSVVGKDDSQWQTEKNDS